jgi:hypothetical protein
VKGRVIRFDYVKDHLQPQDFDSDKEKALKVLVEENKVSLHLYKLMHR